LMFKEKYKTEVGKAKKQTNKKGHNETSGFFFEFFCFCWGYTVCVCVWVEKIAQ